MAAARRRPAITPPTSYTIGIDSVEGTADKTRRATGYEVLKIKVGGRGRPRAAARGPGGDATRALRIDGNEGWTLDTAHALMPELVELGVEFVEQPFPADDIETFRALPRADRRGCRC